MITSKPVSEDPRSNNAFARFFANEAAGGIVLVFAALAALVISNSPWREVYQAFTRIPGTVDIGGALTIPKPLLLWVNDLWMAVF